MTLREISNAGVVIFLFRYLYRWYSRLKQRINNIYHNSKTYRFPKRFWERLKVFFRYSFLGRISETRQTTSGILDSSRVVQYLINLYKRGKDKATRYLRTSIVIILGKDTKEQLNISPMRVISIIVVTAITVNVVLSIALQKQIGLWGWLMRGLFLFAAVSGLFCKADWPTVKRNSVLLRKMRID